MANELRDLYQEMILEHNKKPRNFGKLEHATHHADGFNPLCGDKLSVYLDMDGDTVRDVRFEGSGCAISQASASLMTTTIKGKKIPEVMEIFGRFHHMLSKGIEGKVDTTGLGKLAVFAGVCEYPSRVKCATLAWHTVKAGIEGGGKVTTE